MIGLIIPKALRRGIGFRSAFVSAGVGFAFVRARVHPRRSGPGKTGFSR